MDKPDITVTIRTNSLTFDQTAAIAELYEASESIDIEYEEAEEEVENLKRDYNEGIKAPEEIMKYHHFGDFPPFDGGFTCSVEGNRCVASPPANTTYNVTLDTDLAPEEMLKILTREFSQ